MTSNDSEKMAGATASRPVFVIGSARSGTHWIGYSLAAHPEVRVTIEQSPMFGLSVNMALNPSLEAKLLPQLITAYRAQLRQSAPRLYLEKVHTNIWIAEKLKKAFDRALFIGIERNPYATVASMIRHRKVLSWHNRWREFPVPSRFLGITQKDASNYDSIPLAAQCAMRWLSHHEQMNKLRIALQGDIYVVSYENLARQTEKIIGDLQQFLELRTPIPTPEVKTASLQKWKTQLSEVEIEQITNIVGISSDKFSEGTYE